MSVKSAPNEESHSQHEFYWPRMLLFPALSILGYYGFVMEIGGNSLLAQSAWALGLSSWPSILT